MNDNFLILQNSNLFMERMRFNHATGEMQFFERPPDYIFDGHYAKVNGEIAMLYRKGEKLYINTLRQEFCLDDLRMTYERIETQAGEQILFVIYKGDKKVYSVTYPSFRNDPVNKADIDFNDDREEDQDFCLFLYNVANNAERQRLFLED